MRSNRSSICHFSIVLFAVLISGEAARSQTPSPSPTPAPAASPSLEKEFFKNILRDQKAIWTSPAHVNSRDAPWLIMVGTITGGFLATDRATGDDMATHTGQL